MCVEMFRRRWMIDTRRAPHTATWRSRTRRWRCTTRRCNTTTSTSTQSGNSKTPTQKRERCRIWGIFIAARRTMKRLCLTMRSICAFHKNYRWTLFYLCCIATNCIFPCVNSLDGDEELEYFVESLNVAWWHLLRQNAKHYNTMYPNEIITILEVDC